MPAPNLKLKIHLRSKPKPIFRAVREVTFFNPSETKLSDLKKFIADSLEQGSGSIINMVAIESIDIHDDSLSNGSSSNRQHYDDE